MMVLAHEKHEQPHQERQADNPSAKPCYLGAQFVKCFGVRSNTAVFFVKFHPVDHRIERLPDHFGLPHAEEVGQPDKQDAQQKTPTIDPEEFFEVSEVFHNSEN